MIPVKVNDSFVVGEHQGQFPDRLFVWSRWHLLEKEGYSWNGETKGSGVGQGV